MIPPIRVQVPGSLEPYVEGFWAELLAPIQALLCRILQVPLERYWQIRIDLGSISHVRIDTAAPCLQFVNHVPRLPPRNRRSRR